MSPPAVSDQGVRRHRNEDTARIAKLRAAPASPSSATAVALDRASAPGCPPWRGRAHRRVAARNWRPSSSRRPCAEAARPCSWSHVVPWRSGPPCRSRIRSSARTTCHHRPDHGGGIDRALGPLRRGQHRRQPDRSAEPYSPWGSESDASRLTTPGPRTGWPGYGVRPGLLATRTRTSSRVRPWRRRRFVVDDGDHSRGVRTCSLGGL